MFEKISTYITAARFQTFTISLFPALLGYVLSNTSTPNANATFLFILTAIVVLHAGANLCNTYFDFKDGVDTKEHNSDPTLVEKILSEDQILNAAWLCFAFSMMFFGSGVVFMGRAHLVPYCLFFKGMIVGFNYSGGLRFKHHCLGELVVYSIFGPTIALFSYSCLNKGLFSWLVFIAASPLGLLAAAVLLANNIRDAGNDLKCGVHTVANRLGLKKSLEIYSGLLILPYLQITGLVLLYERHYPLLLSWITVPFSLYCAIRPHRQGVTTAVTDMFPLTLSHYHLVGAVYLGLLTYCMH